MLNRIAYLDGWRGCAIAGVLMDHFLTSRGVNFGRVGVEFFFVLSGRLMADILFVRKSPLVSFYLRRFSRIWPTLFLFVTVMAIFHRWVMPGADWKAILSSFTLTENYYSLYHRTKALDHIWSLCVEEHVYILLGLVALAARSWPRVKPLPVLIVIAALMIANGAILSALLHRDYYAVYWRSDVRGASILIGGIAYLLSLRSAPFIEKLGRWAPALLLIGVALNLNPVPDCIKYSLGTSLLALSLVGLGAANAPSRIKSGLQLAPVTWLGGISYSVYVWQQPLILLGGGLSRHVLLLVAAVVIGAASFYLFERPVRLKLNSLIGQKSAEKGAFAGVVALD